MFDKSLPGFLDGAARPITNSRLHFQNEFFHFINYHSAEPGTARASSEVMGVLECSASQPAVQSDDPGRAEPIRRKRYSWLTPPKKTGDEHQYPAVSSYICTAFNSTLQQRVKSLEPVLGHSQKPHQHLLLNQAALVWCNFFLEIYAKGLEFNVSEKLLQDGDANTCTRGLAGN